MPKKKKVVVLITSVLLLLMSSTAFAKRNLPLTTDRIHVFNDQLSEGMTSRQVRFAATHYDGTQKMVRSETRRFRKYNPNFVVLHYRLGEGLGYQSNGEWIYIIDGDNWIREWPDVTQPEWFYQYGGSNVFNNTYGWYLMDLDNVAWRTYWSDQVISQMANNENDGLFADSFSVPNYFGGNSFTPNLPDLSQGFEDEWSDKIEKFSRYLKQRFGNDYYLIPNAGNWVNGRDKTSYLGTNGVMIEGFGAWDATTPFDIEDWKLQMNRILNMQRYGKVIIAQSYLDSASQRKARMFFLSNYLLIKDKHTYINMDLGFELEWFPEYEINIGRPVSRAPSNTKSLYTRQRVYRRVYTNGWALLNPTNSSRTIRLGRYLFQVVPSGGGFVDNEGRVSGKLSYRKVNKITLRPGTGTVLLKRK